MSGEHDPLRLIINFGAIVALLAVVVLDIRSLSDESVLNPASLATAPPVDALSRELERCRTITPEQLASDGACQRAWAKNRRHFFALDNHPAESSAKNIPTSPSQPSATSPENNSQIDVGRPTTPKPRSE
jgi:conjugative transfer region protein TrbK